MSIRGFCKGGRFYKEQLLLPTSIPRTVSQLQSSSSSNPPTIVPVGATIQPYLLRLLPCLDREVTMMVPTLNTDQLPTRTTPCQVHSQRVNNGKLLLLDGVSSVDVSVIRHAKI
ncbi:hypothetical protein ElyMa_002275800 [Elysia marginata]|uniref:Uncharacterized protein n=1 Tax=Elysia marginata TaxID=1093978 RepID=A0AAV4G1P3_9GAST|nr:hypothetical protein ElyMa_002275800 [Elysia marginata]